MSEVDPTAAVINGDEYIDMPFAAKGADMLERSGLSGRVFYDTSSKQFFMQNSDGEWCGRERRVLADYVKFLGYCPVVRTDKKEKISEVDHLLAHISLNCAVQYAGPIAGFRRGVIENNGQRILVTREAKIMKPEPGEWPLLDVLFQQMFGHGSPDAQNEGENQIPYIYGWWKHALECLNDKYNDKRCLCMVFAGEAGCGKSLLKDLISLTLGGRECKPYNFMIGAEKFNGEFIGSELWVIDDEQGAHTDKNSRLEFGSNIKKVVADRQFMIRGMQQQAVTLEMFKLLLVCLNREPDRLRALPQLDDDIEDKISVLLAHKHPMPMPVGSPEEKTQFWNTMVGELPHFIHYLLNEYEIDREMFGRFGVKHFHHPDLCADLFHVSVEREFWVRLNRVLNKNVFHDDDMGSTWYWCGGAEELYELMSDESSPLSRSEINNLPWSNAIGKDLSKIMKQYPDRVTHRKPGGKKTWFITREGRDVMDAVDLEFSRRKAGKAGSRQAD